MRAPCRLVEAASLGPIGEISTQLTDIRTNCRDLGDSQVRHTAIDIPRSTRLRRLQGLETTKRTLRPTALK